MGIGYSRLDKDWIQNKLNSFETVKTYNVISNSKGIVYRVFNAMRYFKETRLKKLNAGLMIALIQMVIGVLLVGGTSIAFFSDTAEQHANPFSSGKLVVSLKNNHDDQFIDISNLQPGERGSSTFTISNPGTLDFSYQIEIHQSGTLTEGDHPLAITLQDSQGNQVPLNAKRNLSPGGEETLEVIWQLPFDAGNEYQGASAHLSLYVHASQVMSMNARSQ